jgi:succinate dehydrogenase flavin-adding protein (antitoxin of CptAB toxin-antitoxin module)
MEKRMPIRKASGNQRSKEISRFEKMINEPDNKISSMGYKEMPKEQYSKWVKDVDAVSKMQVKENAIVNSKSKNK